jgi:hypothetical protein
MDFQKHTELCSMETTYGLWNKFSNFKTNDDIFVENTETGQFLCLIMLILSCFSCS